MGIKRSNRAGVNKTGEYTTAIYFSGVLRNATNTKQ